MTRRNTRSKSIGVATLKALGTQYSMFDNMFEQVMTLHVEFELELMEILQLINVKNPAIKDSKSLVGTTLQSSTNGTPNSKSGAGATNDENLIDDDMSLSESPPVENTWMRKLFKRIALQCHPDKVLAGTDSTETKHQKLVMYNKARKALDDLNESSMISIGLKYDEVPIIGVKKSKSILASGVKELESAIATRQKTIVWFWGMSEDDFSIKAKLLIQAADQVYNKKITNDEALEIVKTFFHVHEKKKRRKVGEHPGPRLRARRDNVD